MKKVNDIVYRIQLGPRLKPKIVHFNRLFKYSGENPPNWLKMPIGNVAEPTSVPEQLRNHAPKPRVKLQAPFPDEAPEDIILPIVTYQIHRITVVQPI